MTRERKRKVRERTVKLIDARGRIVYMTTREERKWRKKVKTVIRDAEGERLAPRRAKKGAR